MNRIYEKMIQLKSKILNNKKETYLPSNDYTDLLSSKELQQLHIFNKVERFNQMYESLKNKIERVYNKQG